MYLSIFRPYGDKTKVGVPTALGFKPVVEMKPTQYEHNRLQIEFTPQPPDEDGYVLVSVPDKIIVSFLTSDEARAFAVEILQTVEAIDAGEDPEMIVDHHTPLKDTVSLLQENVNVAKKLVQLLDDLTKQ